MKKSPNTQGMSKPEAPISAEGLEPGEGFWFGGEDVVGEASVGGDGGAEFFAVNHFGPGDEDDVHAGAGGGGPFADEKIAFGNAGGGEAGEAGDVDQELAN